MIDFKKKNKLADEWIALNPFRLFRIKHELSVDRAALFTNFSYGTISRWENGVMIPCLKSMDTLKEFLGNDVNRKWMAWYERKP